MVIGFYTKDSDSDIKLAFSRQGAPTSPQTPNQISEMGRLLNSGMKNVEVGALQPETFESIPAQHFQEMKRLAKITDSKVSVHVPLVDPAGFTQQGWSEETREENERHIQSVIDKAHELNPDGNIPVNMHTTLGVPGSTPYTEKGKPKYWEEDTEVGPEHAPIHFKKGEEMKQVMNVVDQERGQLMPLKREVLQYIDEDRTWTPEERLQMLNRTSWDQEKLQLMSYQKAKEELQHMSNRIKQDPKWLELNIAKRNAEMNGEEVPIQVQQELNDMRQRINSHEQQIREYDQHLISGLNNLHHKYTKYRGEPINEHERDNYRRAEKNLESTRKAYQKFDEDFETNYKRIRKSAKEGKISEEEYVDQIHKLELGRDKFHNQLLSALSELPAPHFYIPAEEFTKKKSIETFSNAAVHAYKKYGDKAPLLALENFMPTTVLSRAEGMKDLIEKTREKTAEKLIKEKGLSKSEAKAAAERIIGATWDVGHLHQLRKHGFSDKELVKETEKIAPYVKHVHLTDNFGFSDAHLPLGMGDVPIKEHLKKLEKDADKERVNIIEAGAYPAHFKQSPLPQTLEYLESPVYTYEASPYWSDARDMYASYLVGYGDILPQKHFDTFFGAGFSRLPKELGGQMGNQNRSSFSGTPNQ